MVVLTLRRGLILRLRVPVRIRAIMALHSTIYATRSIRSTRVSSRCYGIQP